MQVGVISDTHDNLPKIVTAIDIFNQKRVDFVFHCGDFIAPFSLNPFQDLKCPWIGVLGNNDGERQGLLKKSNLQIKEPPHPLLLASKKIVLMHEFKEDSFSDADIFLFGHTHQLEIVKKENKLYLNPGEACGWLTQKSSLVILNLENLLAETVYF